MWPLFVAGLAQLVEHLFCKQGVVGSRPTTSTTSFFLPRLRVLSGHGLISSFLFSRFLVCFLASLLRSFCLCLALLLCAVL